MITCKGVTFTDEPNLYNEIFPLRTMYEMYEKQWKDFIPSFASHDHKKSVGFTRLSGIYIDSTKAYMMNSFTAGGNGEENEKIATANYEELYKKNVIDNKEPYDILIKKLKDYIVGEPTKYWTHCVCIQNENIVARIFPDLVAQLKDGLIDIDCLNPVLPGIYKIRDFLIFAHPFFRRGYSYLNTLNTDFLSRLEALDRKSRSIKIAIDLDCIGLAGTEHKEFEYQYSWGPKFDDSLKNIPLGVTRYDNENYDKLLSEILRTEFGWYIQDDKHTFECEEIIDIPNLLIDNNEMYACRFVHSMVDNTTELPIHLDGAIRAYTDEKMIERLDISIKRCERNTDYTKIWRIDGVIPVEIWKELITHYYRDNMIVGEYFNGKDEKINSIRKYCQENEYHSVPLKKYVPCNINRNEGIKIFFSFSPIEQFNEGYDIYIRSNSFLLYGKQIHKYIESETVTLYKLLKRNGLNVRLPFSKRISYNDQVYNYPIFQCKNIQSANAVIDAIKQLSEKWSNNNDDRLVSFTIKVPYKDKIGSFSFLGHIEDFLEYYANGLAFIPEDDNILSWISSSYDFLKEHYGNDVKCIHPFEIINSSGYLSIERNFVPSEKIIPYSKKIIADLVLSADEIEIMQKYNICAVAAYFDKTTTCSKCQKNYEECDCISVIDDNIHEIIEPEEYIGATWTNRSAFL